jgi:hypothetical protein
LTLQDMREQPEEVNKLWDWIKRRITAGLLFVLVLITFFGLVLV